MKIIYVVNGLDVGGIETFLLNVVRHYNNANDEIIFVTYKNKKFDYENEIKALGLRIIKLQPSNSIHFLKYMALYHIFKCEHPDVVHCNTHFDAAGVLFAAKKAEVPVRIAHSHNSITKLTLRRKFLSIIIKKYATVKIACGFEAGRNYYNDDDFIVIENGIVLNDFKFSEKKRNQIREKLNIDDKTVVFGHIGRFCEQKNHKFIIDMFDEYQKTNPNSMLLLLGKGYLLDEVKQLVADKQLSGKVIFLGVRKDAKDFYNVFDIFLLPSLYEGLPVVLVEAQANGLPILASDVIDHNADVTGTVNFLSLSETIDAWAKCALNIDGERKDNLSKLKLCSYDIENVVEKLEKIYHGNIEDDQNVDSFTKYTIKKRKKGKK